ncbi:hypothetical protein [Kytococcus sp. Marseille-QA3725]
MTTNTNLTSRRQVAKGMAWTVPAVAVTAAAPAVAASAVEYEFLGGVAAGQSLDLVSCAGGDGLLTGLKIDNMDPFYGGNPAGVAVGEVNGAPTTTATFEAPLQYVVAFPADMMNQDVLRFDPDGLFQQTAGTNWSAPEVSVVEMTNPDGVTQDYAQFVFTYEPAPTGETVDEGYINGWAGTELAGNFRFNSQYCGSRGEPVATSYFAGGFNGEWSDEATGTFTTTEGYVGNLGLIQGAGGPGWVRLTDSRDTL